MGADIVEQRVWNITLPNRMSELERLAREAERFMLANLLSERSRFTVHMVIEELVTNSIKYSFSDEAEHIIRLSLALEGRRMRLTLADDGEEFDPREAPRPCLNCTLCEAPIGGLGLSMVRSVASEFSYCRRDDHNHIELLIDLD
ncbi:ATP-binding protein [Paucidesulfovibrio longus]|uniref:ATP-binding protein n=1 Tax=Paucidesulfovibrio longus TaxID=889 RepID=UPI0003B747AD|nr:ATP-binding protein [Paucidesulfovibrio longus]